MQGCFIWLLMLAGAVFVIMTLQRWFEQTAEAVDNNWWHKLFLLICMPFAVWLFPGKVVAGRPTPVPRHEPIRGFGSIKSPAAPKPSSAVAPGEIPTAHVAPRSDTPPPGTPAEFLRKQIIPPK